jgi:hypothetical protein
MDQLIKYVVGEMRVIADAPVVFIAALLVIGGSIWWAMRWRYSGIIESKDAVITLYKERLNGATPDQARAKIDSLEGQITSLKSREWPKLTPSATAEFEAALKSAGVQTISIFPQDRDSIFLARDLVEALTRIGWKAARDTSMNGVPDGLSVWPDNDLGRTIRDTLAKATGATVTLRSDEYLTTQKKYAIGIGYRVD